MKSLRYLIYMLSIAFFMTGCEKELDKDTPDQFSDDNFWTSENNVRTYNWGFYDLFAGFGTGTNSDFYFSTFNDDQAATGFQRFDVSAPASNSNWDWTYIRKANVMLERVDKVPMSDEAKNHWKAVARFFRAFDYFNKVRLFGGVPWISKSLDVSEKGIIYKPRDSRELVVDSIIADLDYAVANIRQTDEENTVNKNVALMLKSRIGLYEGTYRKYHTELKLNDAEKFLALSKEASERLMTRKYSLGDFKALYSSMDLRGNPEVLLYKKYLAGVLTHSVIGYTTSTTQMNGPTKSAVESFVTIDGLPIKQSLLYKGDETIANLRANRDKRLLVTIDTFLTYNGSLVSGLSSSTGYRPAKFLQPASTQLAPLNETDAPIFWYAEVLLNYAEACAELASIGKYTITQTDLDKSVNLLRARGGVAKLELSGASVSSSGVVINDPKRDVDVSPLIWEVRRERRVELMMAGFRFQDLMRWKKGDYFDTSKNPDAFLGAKVPANGKILRNQEGYIMPYPSTSTRSFDPKYYLSPIPTGQVSLYPQNVLNQNPGW